MYGSRDPAGVATGGASRSFFASSGMATVPDRIIFDFTVAAHDLDKFIEFLRIVGGFEREAVRRGMFTRALKISASLKMAMRFSMRRPHTEQYQLSATRPAFGKVVRLAARSPAC